MGGVYVSMFPILCTRASIKGYFAPTYPQIRDIYYPTIGGFRCDGLAGGYQRIEQKVHFYSRQTIIEAR